MFIVLDALRWIKKDLLSKFIPIDDLVGSLGGLSSHDVITLIAKMSVVDDFPVYSHFDITGNYENTKYIPARILPAIQLLKEEIISRKTGYYDKCKTAQRIVDLLWNFYGWNEKYIRCIDLLPGIVRNISRKESFEYVKLLKFLTKNKKLEIIENKFSRVYEVSDFYS